MREAPPTDDDHARAGLFAVLTILALAGLAVVGALAILEHFGVGL